MRGDANEWRQKHDALGGRHCDLLQECKDKMATVALARKGRERREHRARNMRRGKAPPQFGAAGEEGGGLSRKK